MRPLAYYTRVDGPLSGMVILSCRGPFGPYACRYEACNREWLADSVARATMLLWIFVRRNDPEVFSYCKDLGWIPPIAAACP